MVEASAALVFRDEHELYAVLLTYFHSFSLFLKYNQCFLFKQLFCVEIPQ